MALKIGYVSEATLFVRDLLEKKPHLLEEQRKARARWWDKQPEPADDQAQAQSRVKQQPYVYQTKS